MGHFPDVVFNDDNKKALTGNNHHAQDTPNGHEFAVRPDHSYLLEVCTAHEMRLNLHRPGNPEMFLVMGFNQLVPYPVVSPIYIRPQHINLRVFPGDGM
jgi:hypothetical protein